MDIVMQNALQKSLEVNVSSEVGRLKRLIIHSPDGGLGKIIPTKAQEWLFEDIVHLDTMRRKEYDFYVKILLYFLDPDKVRGRIAQIDDPKNNRNFYKPTHPEYFNSDKVLDTQRLLMDILDNNDVRNRIVASVCAHEGSVSYARHEMLYALSSADLATVLISGILPNKKVIFAPIPNYIFTRDIAITVNDHIIMTKFAKDARSRENIITKYILFNHPYFAQYRDKFIEITENEDFFLLEEEEQNARCVTVEGGDVMTVAPNHLLIGVSERTSVHAVNKVIKALFAKNVVEKVSVVKIPPKRAYMHIDTTFTQVKRNVWVIFAPFSRGGKDVEKQDIIPSLGELQLSNKLEILQYRPGNLDSPKTYEYLEDLLDEISQVDLKSTQPTEFIYSGDDVFPHASREQWTDSCNVLSIKEGVVIGYDRNDKTADAFKKKGFSVIHASELLDAFERNEMNPDKVENTLILLPSAELSRARGGSHCISMPLWRESLM